jgi:membrane protease YdiL (CAAX protease family)
MTAPDSQETAQRSEPTGWRFTILHCFGLCVLFLTLQFMLVLLIQRSSGLKIEELRWFHFSIVSAIPGTLVLAVGAYLNGFSIHDMLMDHLPDVGGIFSTVAAILGIWILSNELTAILLRYTPFTMEEQANLMQRLLKEDVIGIIIAFGIVVPIVEELIFRGVILDGLSIHYRLSTAVVASSLLFGLVHLNPIVSIATFLLALFLAWLRISTGSLMLCVISHSVFNVTPFILIKIMNVQGGLTSLPSKAVEFQPLWLDALGVLLLLAGIAGLKFSNNEQEDQQEVPQN